jgi:DHA1 family multidrug resistance protein-like MFS transporter
MQDLLRDSTFGQVMRALSRNKVFQYPEERGDFELPSDYGGHEDISEKGSLTDNDADESRSREDTYDKPPQDTQSARPRATPSTSNESIEKPEYDLSKIFSNAEMERVTTRADLEQAYTRAAEREKLSRGPSTAIKPTRTADGVTLVDWYTSDDPGNPQNWSSGKKTMVTTQI